MAKKSSKSEAELRKEYNAAKSHYHRLGNELGRKTGVKKTRKRRK